MLGVAFPADPAEIVAVDVTSFANAWMILPADLAGDVNMKAASFADAGRVFPADISEEATVGVTSLADAGVVILGVIDLADVTRVNMIDATECGDVVI